MGRLCVVILLPFIAALLAGPAAVVISGLAQPDPAGLYLVIGPGSALEGVLAQAGVHEVGPYRAPFGRVVTSAADMHPALADQAVWVLPFSAFAEFCGFDFSV